ncbi:MAG TPA: hypothetical protein DCW90_04620 [Lachnospiraceae bacterium]|nr:hypothetical protein [uncultured Lachnoclostridium sp.]HAU84793.1 hypothetical protein [Lachnospiraceae bacterium]
MNKKRLFIGIIVILGIITGVAVFIKNQNKNEEKEVLNIQYNLFKEEYEEKYNCIKEKVAMKKGYVYQFDWEVTLSTGTCKLDVKDAGEKNLWEKEVSNDKPLEESCKLQSDMEGDANIQMSINKETEGKIKFVVTERKL